MFKEINRIDKKIDTLNEMIVRDKRINDNLIELLVDLKVITKEQANKIYEG